VVGEDVERGEGNNKQQGEAVVNYTEKMIEELFGDGASKDCRVDLVDGMAYYQGLIDKGCGSEYAYERLRELRKLQHYTCEINWNSFEFFFRIPIAIGRWLMRCK
jgi:hypothetical protein